MVRLSFFLFWEKKKKNVIIEINSLTPVGCKIKKKRKKKKKYSTMDLFKVNPFKENSFQQGMANGNY